MSRCAALARVSARDLLCAISALFAVGSSTPGEVEAATGEPDAVQERNDGIGWTPLPVIAHKPETSMVLGAASVFTFYVERPLTDDSEQIRRSSLQFVAAATLKKQYLFEIKPVLYLDGETWQVWGVLDALWFPSTHWGIGNDTPSDADENYTQQRFGSRLGLNRVVYSRLRAGVWTEVHHVDIKDADAGGLIDTGVLPGSEGGWVTGIGPVLLWDTRDNNHSTRRGARYELGATFFTGGLGSDYDFAKVGLDLRQFFPLAFGHVLAVQLYGSVTTEGAPFPLLSLLGGPQRMRGFFEGRYRDYRMVEAQVEYRLPIFWRIGAAAFVGTGDVAPTVDEFDLAEFKVAGGAGLRVEVDRRDRVKIRLDGAANSDGGFNLYLELGEAF